MADNRRELDWSDFDEPSRVTGSPVSGKASDANRDAASISANSLTPSDSPCVAVCSTLYDDICRGCGRTAMEVANWVFMTEAEKRDVWERITAQGYPRRKG